MATGAAWQIGDDIEGLYRVSAVHSQGGMGVVYRVRHLGWNVDLAVKSPRPALFRHPAGRGQFIAEAQTWISLGLYPHLCSCFYVRTIDGIPRIFAEYAEGGSLRDLLDGDGLPDLAADDALGARLDLAIQMAWGLEHAHRLGVIHQDVKPANVLIGADGAAMITDFGLARSRAILATEAGGDASIAVTAGGFTPAYASPEQVAGRTLSRRTDVWSYAVTVLEMFTGSATWDSGPQAPAVLSGLRTDLPTQFATLLGRCLRHEQSQRPDSMADIADQLREIHEREVGAYARAKPTEATPRADELNNRALSQLDLGETEQADALFAEALAVDPNHVEASFNSLTLRWRRAEVSDETAAANLAVARAGAPDRWDGAYLLGQMHLERGDLDAALPLLREAAGAAHDPEVAATLHRAETGELAAGAEERHLDRDGALVPETRLDGWMTAAGISLDGRVAVAARMVRHPKPETAARGYQPPPDEYPMYIFTSAPDRMRTRSAPGVVGKLDVSLDGQLAATVEASDTVRLWDIASGRCLHALSGHTGYIGAIRFSPDNRMLATASSQDHRILAWDVASGECLWQAEERYHGINSFGFSADGSLLASAGEDRKLRIWDPRTGRCRQVIDHPDKLRVVEIGEDNRLAVVGGDDALYGWDLATGERRFVLGGQVMTLWLHDGLVLTGHRNGDMRLWDRSNWRILRTFTGYRDEAARLLFRNEMLHMPLRIDRNGRRAHSVSNRYIARSWGLPTGYRAPLRLCRPRPHARVRELDLRVRALMDTGTAALTNGRLGEALSSLSEARTIAGHERDAAVVSAWRRLSLVTERTGFRAAWLTRVIAIPGDGSLHSSAAAISGDGRHALTAVGGAGMVLWDLESGQEVRRYTQTERPIYTSTLDMNVDGSRAVIGDGYRSIQLWDLRSGARIRELGKPLSSEISIAVDRAGRAALAEQGRGVLRLWDLTNGRELRTFRGPKRMTHFAEGPPRKEQEQVNGVALSSDGRVVVAALQYSGVIYWNGRRRRWRDLDGHDGRVDAARVSADGRFVLTGGWDSTVRYWDITTGECRQVMTGHTHPVTSVDISGDGRFTLSAGMDNTIRIWDVTDGRCVQVLEGVSGATVRIAEDGSRAVSLGNDGLLRVWELDWELTVHAPADWDERARPYLDQHHAGDSFEDLLVRLQRAGLGWIRPEGIQRRLGTRSRRG